jgi:DNA repair protein SbcD/Mre11
VPLAHQLEIGIWVPLVCIGGSLIKILHTADWHLGHELAGWAREGEQVRVLDEIATLAVEHKVDALVVAGDIFDHQNPSSAMYKMLYEFFDRLAIKAPDLISVIIAGNHDSAGRLEAPGPLLKRANVEAIGSLRLRDGQLDLDHHLLAVKRAGKTTGYILAIPYLRPADLPGIKASKEEGAFSSLVRGIKQLYRNAITNSRARIGDKPLVVTGHLHVKGASLSESLSERRIVIGGEHAIPPEIFGEQADYVALGHLHRAQSFGAGQNQKNRKGGKKSKAKPSTKNGCVRYAGSPLPLSVVERTYDHGVSFVEITKTRLEVEHVKLTRPIPFLRVPEKGRLKIDEVEAALEELELDPQSPQESWPFVQIALQIDGPQPGFRGQLDEICTRFAIRDVAPDILWPGQKSSRKKLETIKRLGEHKPVDLFKQAFKAEYGVDPEDEQLACFHQLVDEVGT